MGRASFVRRISLFAALSSAASTASTARAQTWTQVGPRLGSATQTHTSDGFGLSVALAGDTALIGGGIADGQSGTVPAAYVYTRAGSAWSPQGVLVSPNSADADFGPGAVSGDTAIVISSLHAYVFARSGSTWTQQGEPLAGTPFGAGDILQSVALSGNTAIVGGSKAAYVFVRAGTTWAQQGPALLPPSGYAHSFAVSVGLAGDTAAVSDDANTLRVYARNGDTWTEQSPLPTTQLFNIGLASSTLITGEAASQDVRVFGESGSTWTQQGVLSAPAAQIGFGRSVALSGDLAIVGASDRIGDASLVTGAAYVFTRAGGTWSSSGIALLANKSAPTDGGELGFSVAISGATALVGDPYSAGSSVPGAYFFNRACLSNADCPSTAPCENNWCIAHCSVDTDCSVGKRCSATGACQTVPTNGGDGGAAGSDALGDEAGAAGSAAGAEAGAAGRTDALGSAGSEAPESGGAGGRVSGAAGRSAGGASPSAGRGGSGGSPTDLGSAGEFRGLGDDVGSDSGCSCNAVGRSPYGSASAFGLALLGLCWKRRRTRRAERR